MNWKLFDRLRRDAAPMQRSVMEAYQQGRLSRRSFLRRGTIVGLSVPTMGAVLAACGGDDDDDAAPPATEGSDDTASTEPDSAPGTTAAPSAGGILTAGIQTGDANSGLDPLNMLDLGTYSVCAMAFEYLVGLAEDEGIGATGLATEWTPNDDGSAWTFTLREGVTWQDGSPFTSADVAATLDRIAVAGGIVPGLTEGSTETPDDLTVVVNLDGPNGNLPVLLSIFNTQSLITPADYTDGTTLDERPSGTGAWMLQDFDATSFRASFVPNPNWWGGAVNLDEVILQGFDSGGTQVAAMAGGEIDLIQQFAVADGANLLDNPDFTVLKPPSANHRQIWFNTQIPDGGPFTDPRVRQAIGFAVNRQLMVDTLYQGQAQIANDHPVYPTFDGFDASQEQRPRDIEMAKQLLSDAGYADGFDAVIQVGDLQEIPRMAAILEQDLREIGINATVGVTPNSDFYGEYWCAGAEWGAQPDTGSPTAPCGASAEIGIVDYGHRPTPDIYFGRALATGGDWNSSNYNSEEFDGLFADYQAATTADAKSAPISSIQALLHEDTPAVYPIFFDYLAAHSANVSGVQVTALGVLRLQNTSKA